MEGRAGILRTTHLAETTAPRALLTALLEAIARREAPVRRAVRAAALTAAAAVIQVEAGGTRVVVTDAVNNLLPQLLAPGPDIFGAVAYSRSGQRG